MSTGTYTNKAYISDNVDNSEEVTATKNTSQENTENEESNEENRVQWDNPIEFLLSCIAMNVGLGNIWRFPFVAYENGGGAFLIPYILVLMFMGRPMYYLEACMGQFVNRGNVKMFESLALGLKGIGFGQLIGTICVATYYCSLMAITLFYFINSFTADLPWATCNPSWDNVSWINENNITCIPSKSNESAGSQTGSEISSAELYFRVEVLKEYMDISDGIGLPEWRLTLCLLVSWLITFAICAKGIQSSGKASYFLALFPYVILVSLLVRAVTLEGAATGILYFINPKWEMLLSAKVWYAAVTQCFFSLNIGFGSVSMYASYNNFRHNVHRDAMVVTTLDTFTSLLAGTIIFGILGNLAFKMQVDVSEVIKSGGTGLAFISYPEAIARFEVVPWLFAILFFSMLFILGVGSLIALQGCAFTVIMDAFPHLKIWHVSLGTAVLGFIVGLVYITPGGQWIFTMVDFFGGTFIFYVLNILEVVALIWWYGLENICLDITFMTNKKPGLYWRICWCVIVPVVMIGVFVYFLVTIEPLTYEGSLYPNDIIVWGWILLAFGVVQPILWFTYEFIKLRWKNYVPIKKVFKSMFEHTNWGPKNPTVNEKWKDFKSIKSTERDLKLRSKLVEKLCILIGK
ncbi:sodium-dependent nutrient amino acid transporter 1-like [Sitophilus oryzae]|uniref:Transporter n=1 Tax=Sitophilus oryzae TaxID=7048 RepID=A0A6J2YXV3_SITOR|nr:sodium-dependent nutrient amino acid transporter 1-like [Sitophilus oryzae]